MRRNCLWALSVNRVPIILETLLSTFMRNLLIPTTLSLIMVFCATFELSPARASAVADIPRWRWFPDPSYHAGEGGIYPATVLIEGYSIEISPNDNKETIFYAPRVVLKPGFKAAKGSKFRAGTPVMDLHVAILHECAAYPDYPGSPSPTRPGCTTPTTHHGTTRHFIDPQDIVEEINYLNSHFDTIDGDQLVRFRLKSVVEWSDIVSAGLDTADLVARIRDTQGYNSVPNIPMDCDGDGIDDPEYTGDFNCDGTPDKLGEWIRHEFDENPDNILRDHSALNFYIYDSQHAGSGDTGHGKNNGDTPFILVDHDRIGFHILGLRPVGHEMGHAFGLYHTCKEDVTSDAQDSNIMAHGGDCAHACLDYCEPIVPTVQCIATRIGGNRQLGFEYDPYILCECPEGETCPALFRKYQFKPDSYGGRDYGQAEIVLWHAAKIAQNLGLIDSSLQIHVPPVGP